MSSCSRSTEIVNRKSSLGSQNSLTPMGDAWSIFMARAVRLKNVASSIRQEKRAAFGSFVLTAFLSMRRSTATRMTRCSPTKFPNKPPANTVGVVGFFVGVLLGAHDSGRHLDKSISRRVALLVLVSCGCRKLRTSGGEVIGRLGGGGDHCRILSHVRESAGAPLPQISFHCRMMRSKISTD